MILCSKCKKNQIKSYLKIYHCSECTTIEIFKILKCIENEYAPFYVAFNGNSTRYDKQKKIKGIYK